jgi:quinol monooxygenase YgiN
MIHVVAIITAKPGQRSVLLDAFADAVPSVRAESGCIEYSITTDSVNADPAFGPDTVIAIEKWESPAALKAHAASPHMAAFSARVKDACASIAVHRLEGV